MKRPYQVTAIVLLALAVFVLWQAIGMSMYTRLGPGPGLLPAAGAILLGLLAILLMIHATRRESTERPEGFRPTREAAARIVMVIASVVAVIVLLEPLGYQLTMFGFYMVLVPSLGRVRWITVVAVALVGSIGTYQVFHALKLVLPVGPLGF